MSSSARPRGPFFTEFQVHSAVVRYLDLCGDKKSWFWFHPFNKASSAREGKIAKQMGVVAGVPDLIFLASDRSFCLEIKTADGKISSAQKLVHQHLLDLFIDVYVGYGYNACLLILKQQGVVR